MRSGPARRSARSVATPAPGKCSPQEARTVSRVWRTTWRTNRFGSLSRSRQQLRGGPAQFVGRLRHGREGRAQRDGPWHVVEADHGDFVGDAHAAFVNGLEGAEGHEVVGDEHGAGAMGQIEKLIHGHCGRRPGENRCG